MTTVTIDTGRKFVVWDKDDSTKMAALLKRVILEKTARGTSATGAPFKPYEERYAAEVGKLVDLRVTGDMLSKLTGKPARRKASVSVKRPSDGDMWTELTRHFMGLDDAAVDNILAPLVEELMDMHIDAANKPNRKVL